MCARVCSMRVCIISRAVRILDHSTSYEWVGYRLEEVYRYFSPILQRADPGENCFALI